MKPRRTKLISVRVTEAEAIELQRAAEAKGQTLSAYVRRAALRAGTIPVDIKHLQNSYTVGNWPVLRFLPKEQV